MARPWIHPAVEPGQRFGRLVILCRNQTNRRNWLCACDCGGMADIKTSKLRETEVPGCMDCHLERRHIAAMKHGDASGGVIARLHQTWQAMRRRCRNKNCKEYKWYGAKGIMISHEWETYSGFRDWALNNGYEDGLTIDRLNSAGNYEPNNCEWVSKSENSRRMNADRRRKAMEARAQ